MNKKFTFRRSEEGSFSIVAAVTAGVLILAIGASIDLARLSKMKINLQDAVDNATLGGAIAYMTEGKSQMNSRSQKLFKANTSQNKMLLNEKFKIKKGDDDIIYGEATAKVNPVIMNAFGLNKMDIKVTSAATIAGTTGAEVSIAVDTTNSMAFGSSWNHTMGTIEKIMEDMQAFTGDDNFYVTLVPFQDRVNIGDDRKSWITKPFDLDDWDGCVEPREEIIDGHDWMLDNDKASKEKFTPTHENAKRSDGSEMHCPKVSITGPTNDVDKVIDATKKLKKGGSGRYDSGLAWAWRTLSPNWRGEWEEKNYPSKSYSPTLSVKELEKVRKKYIIFMTDGRTTMFNREAMKKEDLGWNNGTKESFENIGRMCTSIKNDGIEIYMLHIPGNPHSTPYFKACASSADHYRVVDSIEDMTFAFNDIKSSLHSQVRLVR